MIGDAYAITSIITALAHKCQFRFAAPPHPAFNRSAHVQAEGAGRFDIAAALWHTRGARMNKTSSLQWDGVFC